MMLLKFKSELPSPVVFPSAALSQLIKTNLRYPETYIHSFIQNRLDTYLNTYIFICLPTHHSFFTVTTNDVMSVLFTCYLTIVSRKEKHSLLLSKLHCFFR